MEIDLAFWSICVRAVLMVSAFILFAWALRRMRRNLAGQLDQVLASQEKTRAEMLALAEKLSAIATLVATIPARSEPQIVEAPPRQRREAPPVRSYETARRLARSGATVDEIVATCGIAGTEARLLRRLHGAGSERDSAA